MNSSLFFAKINKTFSFEFSLLILAVPECVSLKTKKVSSILPNSTINNGDNSTAKLYPRFYHLNTNTKWQEKGITIRQQQKGPCSCFELNCGCCAGMQFRRFKRIRKFKYENFQCNENVAVFHWFTTEFFLYSLFQFHIRSEWISR